MRNRMSWLLETTRKVKGELLTEVCLRMEMAKKEGREKWKIHSPLYVWLDLENRKNCGEGRAHTSERVNQKEEHGSRTEQTWVEKVKDISSTRSKDKERSRDITKGRQQKTTPRDTNKRQRIWTTKDNIKGQHQSLRTTPRDNTKTYGQHQGTTKDNIKAQGQHQRTNIDNSNA